MCEVNTEYPDEEEIAMCKVDDEHPTEEEIAMCKANIRCPKERQLVIYSDYLRKSYEKNGGFEGLEKPIEFLDVIIMVATHNLKCTNCLIEIIKQTDINNKTPSVWVDFNVANRHISGNFNTKKKNPQ